LTEVQVYVVQGDGEHGLFGIVSDGRRHEWRFSDLFAAVQDREPRPVSIESLGILDKDIWFARTGREPTLRNIAEEVTRIGRADCTSPAIIVTGLGVVDGTHRAVQAYLRGEEYLDCVEFSLDELQRIPHVQKPCPDRPG